jgi:arylsulfatase A-like enzyme
VSRERRGGFRTWLGYENNNSQWDCHVHGHEDDGAEVAHRRLPGYETDDLTDLLLGYLKRRAEAPEATPFFASLSVQPPHNPYVAPAEWMARHSPADVQLRPNVPTIPRIVERARRELAGYNAMIENLDWNLGRIRQELADLGISDDTHILFFSDHGDMHGSHGQFLKTNPYEESIRVPFIIGGSPLYGRKCGIEALPINHVDVGPTSLGLCGIEPPAWMEGTDFSGHRLRGKPPTEEPDSAYLQLVIPTGHGHSTDRPWRGIVTRDGWKYACLEGQPWMLFDLNEDPYEQANLALNLAYSAKRRELQDRLARWIADTGDHFELPDITSHPRTAQDARKLPICKNE